MIGATRLRPTSAIAVDDEVRDERENLALLRGWERLEVGLRRLRIAGRARTRILHAVVLEHEAADLVHLARRQRRALEKPAHALGLDGGGAFEHRDEWQRPLALAEVTANRLAETLFVGHEVEGVVGDLEGHADVHPVAGQRLDLLGPEPTEKRADAAARRDERGRLLADDAQVGGLGGEAVPLSLELKH